MTSFEGGPRIEGWHSHVWSANRTGRLIRCVGQETGSAREKCRHPIVVITVYAEIRCY